MSESLTWCSPSCLTAVVAASNQRSRSGQRFHGYNWLHQADVSLLDCGWRPRTKPCFPSNKAHITSSSRSTAPLFHTQVAQGSLPGIHTSSRLTIRPPVEEILLNPHWTSDSYHQQRYPACVSLNLLEQPELWFDIKLTLFSPCPTNNTHIGGNGFLLNHITHPPFYVVCLWHLNAFHLKTHPICSILPNEDDKKTAFIRQIS